MAELSGTLDRPGCALRFSASQGRDPAVVFLHGAGADHVMCEEQAAAITATGQRAVLVDLRGHGASRPNQQELSAALLVEDVEALMANLRLERPVLAGHSLGGNLAQNLVRRSPEAYAGLIVMDSTWNTGPLNALERFALRLAAPGLALIPARSLPSVMANASAVSAAARADAERAFSQLSKIEFLDVWRATVSFVNPDPDYRTPVPLLLVRGAADKTGNIATAMAAWAKAEGVPEHVIPDAGHIVTQDASAATTAVLLEFLALDNS